jgi:hypothetical protein
MGNNTVARRLVQLGGLLLVGNGLMGLLKPRWHAVLWQYGPQLTHAMSEELAVHPKTARAVYLAQAAVGLALVRETTGCDCG